MGPLFHIVMYPPQYCILLNLFPVYIILHGLSYCPVSSINNLFPVYILYILCVFVLIKHFTFEHLKCLLIR